MSKGGEPQFVRSPADVKTVAGLPSGHRDAVVVAAMPRAVNRQVPVTQKHQCARIARITHARNIFNDNDGNVV